MSEMIERVANAIAAAAESNSDTMYANMARAAIEAMREPTQQQMTEGYRFLLADSSKNGYGDRTDAEKLERMRGFYRAMIGACG